MNLDVKKWDENEDEMEKERETILEFEFQNEEGTGLGPTLEYYNLIVSGLLERDILMSDQESNYYPIGTCPVEYM